ncbi:hypothetical protein RI367_000519 [Sorochytrium milnesiophthora]
MGQLLALLRGGDSGGSVPSIDLENPSPTAREAELVKAVRALLSSSPDLLSQLKCYKGCEDQIRQAISKPSQQTESDAWNAVVPSVIKLKTFYEYSLSIEATLPPILDILCTSSGQGSDAQEVTRNLEQYQATAKCFADIVNFAWEFDEIKMVTPAIQNDFSYYRRTLSRLKGSSGEASVHNVPVNDELANRMSLFYAYPGPMLKMIIDATNTYVSEKGLTDKVTNCLNVLSGVCNQAVTSSKLSNPAANVFALRVMVACIVMYDHIHSVGAFKNSQVNIKAYVKTIQSSGGPATTTFMNALKYSTKTYNQPDTPKSVKSLLE